MIERTLERYRLLEEVGQGGMAVVYKGFDTTLNREVAVKVLHPHLAGQQESRARLQREAHAVAKLRHENILEIFDYSGPDSAESYIVTEFIHGQTLKNFLVGHPLPFPEIAQMIASEVARALEHAHSLGVIHRDVKPENVMIRDDGVLKLMDFGIAQIVDKERMTVTGQLLGSPAYMAPEHVEGRPLDFRTDVFAVGILTYQLATGQLPFRGKNPHEVLKRIAECKFTLPQAVNPLVGARLSRVIVKALARDPNGRFADVALFRGELMADLAEVGVDDPRRELTRFFADPKGFAAEFKPRLVANLTARGRELAKRGRTALALELWGRGLALAPKSPELSTLVGGAWRRRRYGRAAAGVLGIAALALGAWSGARWLADHPRAPSPPAEALLPARITAAPAPQTEPSPLATSSAPMAPIAVTSPPHPAHPVRPPHPAAPAVAPRRFTLAPVPRRVRVSVDGQTAFDFDPSSPALTLTADKPHTIKFSADCCFDHTEPIEPGAPQRTLDVRLEWKPAQLRIRAEPASADVLVDDKPYPAGQRIPVAMSSSSRTVTVKITARGYQTKTLEVKVNANQATEERVALERTEGAE